MIIVPGNVLVSAQCMTVRKQTEAKVPHGGNALRKKNLEADYDSAEVSGEDWEQVFQKNSPWNDTALLPTSVYNFQTGEVAFFNWDLNGSAANNFPKAQQYSDEAVPLREVDLSSGEDRPRRYSSKYAKADESNIDENYEILKEPKAEADSQEDTSVPEDKENLQREENEQYEVYEHKKPQVVDNEKAESGHESKKPANKKHSEGEGEEHHEDHHNKKKTKGVKEYKGEHHYHKGEKGHHDKEDHKGQYSDKKGSTKSHKEGAGHFEAGVHGEKGQKEAKHSDKEEYKKGHSTRGGHVVHKKDEYEKKHEFYDEHHEGGDSEKHGEYFEEHHAKSGGHKKGGHKQGEAAGEHKAKKGHYEKGNKFHEHKGHKKAGGHEKKHGHDEKYGKKQGHSDWKKFGYESGKGHKGGDSGGAHSNVGHLLAVPPVPASAQSFPQRQLPQFQADQGGKETKPAPTKAVEETEDKSAVKLPPADTSAVFDESAPIPSTELKPPPFLTPKLVVLVMSPKAEGTQFPPGENSQEERPMDFREFLEGRNAFRSFDSFSAMDDNEKQAHRIVKKQMAVSDYGDGFKRKRSAVPRGGGFPRSDRSTEDGEREECEKSCASAIPSTSPGSKTRSASALRRVKRLTPDQKESPTRGAKRSAKKDKKPTQNTQWKVSSPLKSLVGFSCPVYQRFPDANDCHSYYECGSNKEGCLTLQHKQCPDGEVFSPKYLECLHPGYLKIVGANLLSKRYAVGPAFAHKKSDVPGLFSDEVEPSNEWLDATQGTDPKIPNEFKPKKKPILRIYHLLSKRQPNELVQEKSLGKRHNINSLGCRPQKHLIQRSRAVSNKQSFHRHHPRSFLIHIKKKEKLNGGDGVTENEEGDDEETDENDDDEEEEEIDDDEDDEEEEPEPEPEAGAKKSSGLKEFFRSAKAAVTNRVKFNDGSSESLTVNMDNSSLTSAKTERPNLSTTSSDASKNVLIDANIKVDKAIGNALKHFLEGPKGKNLKIVTKSAGSGGYNSDRESQDQMDPELTKKYENLIRSNPRM